MPERRCVSARRLLDALPPLPLHEPHRRAIFEALKLSERQIAIAELVLRDAGNREIAVILGIGEGTVKTQQKRMFRRTGTNSRMQFAMRFLAVSHQITHADGCLPDGRHPCG